jgi:hypothetical protein
MVFIGLATSFSILHFLVLGAVIPQAENGFAGIFWVFFSLLRFSLYSSHITI